ncbi:hypothetical protein Tco_0455592 [Tanacetum coccineum]
MANVTSLLTSLCTKIHDFSNPNQASSSSTLPSNTIPNPRNEARAITTRSGVSYEGPSIPMPPPFVNPDVVEETSTDHVPPPLTQKVQETNSQTTTKVNQEGIVNNPKTYELKLPYPERRNVEKRQEKDKVQLQKFWKMFKQLHFNISLADALILMPKYTKMLKDLCANKEKLEELANTPLSENCLADLGASINLMPLSVFHRLGFTNLESTQMTLELANRQLCRPDGICKDVLVPEFDSHRGIDLTSFPPLKSFSSNPTYPTLTGERRVCYGEHPMFFSLVRFVWKMMTRIAIRKKIMCILAAFLHKKPKTLSRPQEIEEIKEQVEEVSSDVPIHTIVMPIRITFDNPTDFNDHFSKRKDLKKDLPISFDSATTSILVYHAIHDKNLVILEKNSKENISSGTLLVFREPSILLPTPEPPDECLKNVVLNFYQSKKMFPLHVEDTFAFIIWTFLPFFTYTKASPVIFFFRSENFVFDPGIITSYNPIESVRLRDKEWHRVMIYFYNPKSFKICLLLLSEGMRYVKNKIYKGNSVCQEKIVTQRTVDRVIQRSLRKSERPRSREDHALAYLLDLCR